MQESQKSQDRDHKQPYQRPVLQTHGKIEQLTTQGLPSPSNIIIDGN
jgi:hypothetical protein